MTASTLALGKEYLLPVYARPDFVLAHGKGAYVWDVDGNKYLDFSAGIAVNALGHADEGVLQVCTCFFVPCFCGLSCYWMRWMPCKGALDICWFSLAACVSIVRARPAEFYFRVRTVKNRCLWRSVLHSRGPKNLYFETFISHRRERMHLIPWLCTRSLSRMGITCLYRKWVEFGAGCVLVPSGRLSVPSLLFLSTIFKIAWNSTLIID